jgi:hypothetical protein
VPAESRGRSGDSGSGGVVVCATLLLLVVINIARDIGAPAHSGDLLMVLLGYTGGGTDIWLTAVVRHLFVTQCGGDSLRQIACTEPSLLKRRHQLGPTEFTTIIRKMQKVATARPVV